MKIQSSTDEPRGTWDGSKIKRFLLGLTALVCLNSFANDKPRPRLTDRWGVPRTLTFFKEQRPEIRTMALVFMKDNCPIIRRYQKRLVELNSQFRSRGVELFGVFSNEGDNVEHMNRMAHQQDWPFPVVLDQYGKLAKLLGAERSSEVVVLDTHKEVDFGAVVYRGPINDQLTIRDTKGGVVNEYLTRSLEAFLADGKKDSERRNEVNGCELEFEAEPPGKKGEATVTYNQHIAPLIVKKCQTCHRAGSVAPFELMTYEDASNMASTISRRVRDRVMPPWHADLNPKFGKLKFDNRLTESEIALFTEWSKQGSVEGPGKPPVNPKWPAADEWGIGQPDFVYKMPEPFKIPATGVLEYQFFPVKLNNPKDLWVKKMEIKPGDPTVVHHIVVHLVKHSDSIVPGFSPMWALYGLTGENASFLGGYLPGDENSAQALDVNEGLLIPAGSDLIFEMHYTTNGTATQDQSQMGLVFTDKRPEKFRRNKIFRKPRGSIDILPGDIHSHSEQHYYFKEDIQLLAIYPHLHARGKDYRLEMVENLGTPSEKATEILAVPNYDFNWQRTYSLEKPIGLKAGTPLRAVIHWDNSPYNPNNPDPKRRVPYGIQTFDEMFSTRFNYVILGEGTSMRPARQFYRPAMIRAGSFCFPVSSVSSNALAPAWPCGRPKAVRRTPKRMPRNGPRNGFRRSSTERSIPAWALASGT